MNIPTNSTTTTQNQTTNPTQAKTDPLASKDTFLQLLVAQLRNQDPLQPQDGTAFLTQLAQFSSLEQTVQLRQEVTAIKDALDALAGNAKASNT